MSIVLLGCGGQLGTELQRRLPEAVGLSHHEADLTDAHGWPAIFERYQPEWIINCAAYNQVDRAESEPVAAFAGNALGPRGLAQTCRERNCRLVHVGSDYVFGGETLPRRPRREEDYCLPLSVYGESKLAGEHFVLAEQEQNLVIRTCGLYGQGGKGNFVRTMLRLAEQGKTIRVVNDQFCSPTAVSDLAEAILILMKQQATGLFHVVNQGEISWYEFARQIFSLANLSVDLQPIDSASYGAAARRPPYSVLDCRKYEQQTGHTLPPIATALQDFLNSL